MPTPIWSAEIRDGLIHLDQRDALARWLATRRNGRYDLIVKEHRDRRTDPQNRYLHGVVFPIGAAFCGYTVEEFKDAMKWEHLRKDGLVPTVRSTADLDTREMTEFIEAIRCQMAQMGCSIPGPNEVE
jgi:hypothetical protein